MLQVLCTHALWSFAHVDLIKYKTYIVLICFVNDIIKKSIWHVMLFASLLQFIHCDVATTIFVEI